MKRLHFFVFTILLVVISIGCQKDNVTISSEEIGVDQNTIVQDTTSQDTIYEMYYQKGEHPFSNGEYFSAWRFISQVPEIERRNYLMYLIHDNQAILVANGCFNYKIKKWYFSVFEIVGNEVGDYTKGEVGEKVLVVHVKDITSFDPEELKKVACRTFVLKHGIKTPPGNSEGYTQ